MFIYVWPFSEHLVNANLIQVPSSEKVSYYMVYNKHWIKKHENLLTMIKANANLKKTSEKPHQIIKLQETLQKICLWNAAIFCHVWITVPTRCPIYTASICKKIFKKSTAPLEILLLQKSLYKDWAIYNNCRIYKKVSLFSVHKIYHSNKWDACFTHLLWTYLNLLTLDVSWIGQLYKRIVLQSWNFTTINQHKTLNSFQGISCFKQFLSIQKYQNWPKYSILQELCKIQAPELIFTK